jgi:hypothetical protein
MLNDSVCQFGKIWEKNIFLTSGIFSWWGMSHGAQNQHNDTLCNITEIIILVNPNK